MAENYEALENARKLSIAGDYLGALARIETVLAKNPHEVEALRLKGNVIELRVFERELNSGEAFVRSPEVLKARACYEQALLLQPEHIGVLADLGTHWKNLGNNNKALEFFDKVIALLPVAPNVEFDSDPIVEALEGKIEILEEQGDTEGAQRVQQQLRLLESPNS